MSIPEKKELKKNIWLVGLASFFNDVSSEMILPILPLFITSLGGTGIAIGLIGGLRDSSAEILKAFFGYWSDNIGKRKVFIYAGYLTSAFFKLMLIFSHSWFTVFLLVGLERIGKALRTSPRDALITQSSPEEIGRGFGIHRMFDTLGAVIGSLIAFFLAWELNFGLTSIILISSIISLFSIVPLGKIVDIAPQKNQALVRPKIFDYWNQFSRQYFMFTLIACFFSLANISYMFLIVHAQNILNHGTPISTGMLLHVLFNIFYASFATPVGILSDRIGRKFLIIIGYFLFAWSMFFLCYAHTFADLVICFSLYGISTALIKVCHKAFAADLSPGHLKAAALGSFEAITGIVTFATGVAAGLLWEILPHHYVFLGAGLCALIASGLLSINRHKDTFQS